jgi:hypothetical protein
MKTAVKQVDLHSYLRWCILFYASAPGVYAVGWLPDTETYKQFNAKHAFLASPGKALELSCCNMHAQDLCSKKTSLYRKENRDDETFC